MIGSLDNFKLGMGLSATPYQRLPASNANFDGLDGLSEMITLKNVAIAVALILIIKKLKG